MFNLRPHVLVAVVLTLIVSACSQVPERAVPGLAPQLGPPGTVAGVGAALSRAGQLYALTEDHTSVEDENFGHTEIERATLSRYSRSGSLLWERQVGEWWCHTELYDPSCGSFDALDTAADHAGNAYTLVYYRYEGCEGTYEAYSAQITKLNASGADLWSKDVGNMSAFFVDPSGNVYVVGNNDTGYGQACDYEGTDTDPPYAEIVRKYTTDGALLWERKLDAAVGTPTDVTVSGSGSVYVGGSAGTSRYSGLGSLTWTKSGAAHEVVVSGPNLYTRAGTTLRRLSGTGKQLWSKTISSLNRPTPLRLAGDTAGNLYVAGAYMTSSRGSDAFVRKYSGSGSLVWSRGFGTDANDTARGVASYDGSEIYVVGDAPGWLAGTAAYLRKMDRNGTRVWAR